MNEDNDLVWQMERSHEAYLTWIALWLASIIGIVTILASVISRQGTLSPNHLVLIWLLYWGLVSGMIFSVYRLVNVLKQNLSWAIKIKKRATIKEEAKKRGGFSRLFVYIKNENTEDERVEIHEFYRILSYFMHLISAGFLFWLAVDKPCWVIVTASIIFVLSTFLDLRLSRDSEIKTNQK